MAQKRARRAGKSTTVTSTSADGATITTRRRGPATHSQIRLTLDLGAAGGPAPAPLARAPQTMAEAIGLLHPSQREGLVSAARSGGGWRLVVVFLPSDSRDVDEAIRALPEALRATVVSAEKL